MSGTEIRKEPKGTRAKILPGLPKAFAGAGYFHNKGGKRYISETMTLFILSRRAFLETRLEKHGKLFMGEVRSFVKSLFDRGKATAVEYGNKEDLEILAAPRYVFLSMDDDPETQEMKLDAISNFCIPGAESDLAFLDTMKRKFFQHVPVSEAEENRLKEMEQNQSYSRYFRTITE